MAIRRHRLPRFWLALTLGLVAAVIGAARWWEGQLPGRLERAASEGRYEACLAYSDQLASLRWMTGRAPREQGRCRRARAERLWQGQRWQEALQLQLLLANSEAGIQADRDRLRSWQEELRTKAMARFEAGDLEGAMVFLKPMGEDRHPAGDALGDNLREFWSRNRFQQERATQLVEQKRWWEALEALNRIDHPWWKSQSAVLRRQVETAISGLKTQEQEHHSHGATAANSVPVAELDAAIKGLLAQGVDDWSAFTRACRQLGGKVVESGPETTCQR